MVLKRIFLTTARSIVVLLLALGVLLLVAYAALGYSPRYLYNAPSVATGIGAKLACSMRYVMAHDEQQAASDIRVYSPLLGLLRYEYDDQQQQVTAAMGPFRRQADFLPNTGCALQYDEDVRERVVWRNGHQASAPWPQGHHVDELDPLLQSRLVAMLQRDNEQGQDTRALLVVHQGRVVAEAYAPGYDENSLFLGWSMTKSVNGLLVGQQVLQGRMQVDEDHLFPQWQDERRSIQLQHLLHMTDGLAYDEIYDPGKVAPRMFFQEPSAADFMLSLPLRHTPGRVYEYSSGASNLLAHLVQQRLAEPSYTAVSVIAETFFQPLGMTHALYETDNAGLLMASSYLYASARDWAKFGQLMLNQGELNGVRFVSKEWVEQSLQPNSSSNRPDFGYQWWLNHGHSHARWPSLPSNAFAAQGNREQRLMVLPDQELVMVRLGWSPSKYPTDANMAEIMSWF
ncbi:MAG: serine hydrolase [Bacterioplanes sp.]|nr:serine hydrolase [Bacterioplanes sp.]